jgi:hypothetical protein
VAAARRTSTGIAVLLGLGAVVGAGLVAVVLASRGVPGDRTTAAYSSSPDDRLQLAMFVVVVVAGTALLIWSAWPDGERSFQRPERSWWRHYLLSLVVLLAFVLVGSAREELRHRELLDRRVERSSPAARRTVRSNGDPWLPASGKASIELGVAVVAVAAAVAGRALARRRAATPVLVLRAAATSALSPLPPAGGAGFVVTPPA